MVRFIMVLEWIYPVKGTTYRSVPMRTGKGIRKINEERHKVYTFIGFIKRKLI